MGDKPFADIGLHSLAADNPFEQAGREYIARMVATEPGTLWADGHQIMTCGGHTGHTVRAIAYCQDATWATAICAAISPSPTTRERELTSALEARDAAVALCPFGAAWKGWQYDPSKPCPKCGARSDQNCGPTATAGDQFIAAARAALQSREPE